MIQPTAADWATPGSAAVHRFYIEQAYNQKFGRDMPVDLREQLANSSGDINQIRNLISGAQSDQDLANTVERQAVDRQTAKAAQDRQALLDKQAADQASLFGQYNTQIGGQEKLQDAYARLAAQAGLPDITKGIQAYTGQINSVKSLLDNLTQDVHDRNTGTFSTDAQNRRVIAAEGTPLNTQLGQLGYGLNNLSSIYNTASGQIGAQLTAEQQQQQKELMPIQAQLSAMNDRYAREISGFNQSSQDTLNSLMEQLQAGQQLTSQQAQAANALVQQKQQYDLALRNNNNQYHTIDAGDRWILTDQVGNKIGEIPKGTDPNTVYQVNPPPSPYVNTPIPTGGGNNPIGGNTGSSTLNTFLNNSGSGSGSFGGSLQGSSGGNLQGGSSTSLQGGGSGFNLFGSPFKGSISF